MKSYKVNMTRQIICNTLHAHVGITRHSHEQINLAVPRQAATSQLSIPYSPENAIDWLG